MHGMREGKEKGETDEVQSLDQKQWLEEPEKEDSQRDEDEGWSHCHSVYSVWHVSTLSLPSLWKMLMTTMMSMEKNMFKNERKCLAFGFSKFPGGIYLVFQETLIPKHIHWSEGSHSLMFPWFNVKKETKTRDRWNSLERVCHAFSLNFIRHRFLLPCLLQQLLSFVNPFLWMLHIKQVAVEYFLQSFYFLLSFWCWQWSKSMPWPKSLWLLFVISLSYSDLKMPFLFSLTWIPFLSAASSLSLREDKRKGLLLIWMWVIVSPTDTQSQSVLPYFTEGSRRCKKNKEGEPEKDEVKEDKRTEWNRVEKRQQRRRGK